MDGDGNSGRQLIGNAQFQLVIVPALNFSLSIVRDLIKWGGL